MSGPPYFSSVKWPALSIVDLGSDPSRAILPSAPTNAIQWSSLPLIRFCSKKKTLLFLIQSNDAGMQLGLRRTMRCAAMSATAEAYGLRRRIETYASPRIKMVGGAPWGGSHPRHNAGQREQRLSARACGSPRWAGGVETSCGGGRGWRPRLCWDPGDRCANRGRASGWDPPWPRPPL